MSQEQNKKRPMMGHGPGRGMMPGEKAKNFTGTIQKLFAYLGSYRIVLGVVILFAIGSTVFNIIGPKVLSKVTTELFNGLVAVFILKKSAGFCCCCLEFTVSAQCLTSFRAG